MKKFFAISIMVLGIGSTVFGQCDMAGFTITGSKTASKCYGSLATLNGISAKHSYYYNYEYSAFTKSPIACETPVYNNDSGTFFGRSRSWSNNMACPTIFGGCPSPASGNQTVYVFWGVNSAGYVSNLLMEACNANGSIWICAGTGLPTWANGTPTTCGSADATYHPSLSITSGSCSSYTPPLNCAISLSIVNPVGNAGLYGTAGISLISGYQIYINNTSSKAPASGADANWTATSTFIPYQAGYSSSGTLNFAFTDSSPLYIAFKIVFNNRAGTAVSTLESAGLMTTGNVAQAHPAAPYYAEFVPTAVTLTSFTAKYRDLEHVDLAWTTASENDSMGFNIYRSLDGENWRQANSALIPAKGVGGGGADYAFTDVLPRERTYLEWQYRLEEVDNGGNHNDVATATVEK
jgi:hypothetical protein